MPTLHRSYIEAGDLVQNTGPSMGSMDELRLSTNERDSMQYFGRELVPVSAATTA